MEYNNIYNNEEIIETRGRKPLFTNETLDADIEKFIAWVEHRYTPVTEMEVEDLHAFGERVYPYLTELQHYSK